MTTLNAEESVKHFKRERIQTAEAMADYIASLSTLCRNYGWHKSGLHLSIAADELEQMLNKNALVQERYAVHALMQKSLPRKSARN